MLIYGNIYWYSFYKHTWIIKSWNECGLEIEIIHPAGCGNVFIFSHEIKAWSTILPEFCFNLEYNTKKIFGEKD